MKEIILNDDTYKLLEEIRTELKINFSYDTIINVALKKEIKYIKKEMKGGLKK